MAKKIQTILFIDTNIFLDFYRCKTEAELKLLNRLEGVSAKIIVTDQLEMEFKKNRQGAIIEGYTNLKAPETIQRPGVFSNKKSVASINQAIKKAKDHVLILRKHYLQVLKRPLEIDPVYRATEKIFRKNDDLVLSKSSGNYSDIYLEAQKKFQLGNPPRKPKDSSMGDAINWHWMISCAKARKANLIVVSRDGDFGVTVGKESHINDFLSHEFKSFVGAKCKVILYDKLTEALNKHFEVKITTEEKQAEDRIISEGKGDNSSAVIQNLDSPTIYFPEQEEVDEDSFKPDLSPIKLKKTTTKK